MIYLVTNSQDLFGLEGVKTISVEESLSILEPLKVVGLDTETSGLRVHRDTLLSLQLGCFDFQVVIDCLTVDIRRYKDYIESNRLFVLHNAKFDLQWLYKYSIVPRNIYDLFLAEKVLWLGFPIILTEEVWLTIRNPRYDYVPSDVKKRTNPYYILYMNLKKLGEMYLGVELDKTVRGQVIYKGLCFETIVYAAHDVKYLEQIMNKQLLLLKDRGLVTAVDYENRSVLPIAYMTFCGVKLDIDRWKAKMDKDKQALDKVVKEMNDWLISNEPNSKYIIRDLQGDLFLGFNPEPVVTLNWNSSQKVIPIFKKYGVDTSKLDKETKESKDSIDAKVLGPQKDKCSLIPLYLKYKEMMKLCSTYGENVLKQIDENTGRLYTNYNSIGTDTCRISSGGKDKAAGIEYINMLNMPADAETRSCFVAEKGNRWISIDYSGQESFIMADIANDKAMIDELMYGEKDLHTLTAKIVFPEIPKDMSAKEVKKKFHNERQLSKGYEFAFNYAGNDSTIMRNFGLTPERAKEIYDSYMKGFDGLKKYQEFRKKDWFSKGYIDLNPVAGYKAYIYDYNYLIELQQSFKEPGFWDYYRKMKAEAPSSDTVQKVRHFFKRKADSDRQSVNYPIQHTGALCWKVSMVNFFEYLRDNNLLFKVLITVAPYDEINCEAPEDIAESVAETLYKIMIDAGAFFVKRCRLDADISRLDDGSLPTYWVH